MLNSIVLLEELNIRQTCDFCRKENTILDTTLVLGVEHGPHFGVDIIVLPACPSCGAVEHLNRATGTLPLIGLPPQRVLVNTIADYLKVVGKTHPRGEAHYKTEPACCAVSLQVEPNKEINLEIIEETIRARVNA